MQPIVTEKKAFYYKKRIEDCGSDTSKLYKVVNKIFGKQLKNNELPEEHNNVVSAGKVQRVLHIEGSDCCF